MPRSDDFHQLALRFTDPIQHDYEVIRGLVLADETIIEWSQITGVDRNTISEKAQRFLEGGMVGLVDYRTTTEKGQHQYPDVVAGTILYLKQLYPGIHYREIARIIERKYGHKTHHLTVKRFLVRIAEDRHWVYSLLILEGYARKILAGMTTEHQDLIAVLQLLNAALIQS